VLLTLTRDVFDARKSIRELASELPELFKLEARENNDVNDFVAYLSRLCLRAVCNAM
jgi:hypothetical protein